MTNPVSQVGMTLGFFASVIKSGESWSKTCDEEYKKAESALSLVRASLDGNTCRIFAIPVHCPFCGHDPKVDFVYHNPNWKLAVFCETKDCRIHNIAMSYEEWNSRPKRIVPGW